MKIAFQTVFRPHSLYHNGICLKKRENTLLNFSIEKMNVKKFDVNEQNEQAVDFYKKCGFETTSRSELDSSGKPYPTLHMELIN
ncbi:GNAT family N-acetyltransferase [Chryseobacterium luquanense]|uniref:GNAT family N-acetyltransferase n=1 Tax=Chryseobacterium luquanense TaxID=2983766 RepID=A0ABT3XYH4_9FLAO|nr:GNAT family N-acetyltransferase [Chryseobacterium luquanense]MCX8530938.1 GNAT family N-acetyltransferase [Chryseobacterium luquanense]